MFMKAKKLILTGALFMMMLALCAIGVGCSGSSSSASVKTSSENQVSESAPASASEASQETATSSAGAADAKPSKNGFDKSTNNVISVGGIDFQIPAYFAAENGQNSYYAEKGAGVTLLHTDEMDDVSMSVDEFEKNESTLVNEYVSGVSKSADEISEPTLNDAKVAGYPAVEFSFTFKVQGVGTLTKATLFFNNESKMVGVISLTQSDESTYDYFADYDAIISSAVKGEVKPKVPTLGSTIEFKGLSIELGKELQTTTLNNQFSDKNGMTVLFFPVKVTNNSDAATKLNMYAVKAFGSQGTELETVFTYFDDDIRMAGDMRPGASQEGNLYFPYDGDGTYYLDFGFYKTEVEVEIPVQL